MANRMNISDFARNFAKNLYVYTHGGMALSLHVFLTAGAGKCVSVLQRCKLLLIGFMKTLVVCRVVSFSQTPHNGYHLDLPHSSGHQHFVFKC